MANKEKNLEAVKSAETLASLATSDLEDAVIRAALDGASWAEIGEVLGVSKQTAHNRYAKSVDIAARIEAGEGHYAIDSEQYMGRIYNPAPRVVINMKRDYGYRRTRRDHAPGQ